MREERRLQTARQSSTIANGRYRLTRPLAQGGMALVCEAEDQQLHVRRAIKVLLPEFAAKHGVRRRFESEAATMAQMAHRNVVRVYDVGTAGNLPYLVMELISGGSLMEWVTRYGAMPPQIACRAILQTCRGIEAAHSLGVIHRDVKPHNILVDVDGSCKLTDFGIAHIDNLSRTKTGAVLGTLGYMAPEQLSDASSVDERTDVYAVAATLWKLLTDGPIDSLSIELREAGLRGVAAPLRPVLRRALSYHPEQRHARMSEFRLALTEAAGQLRPDPSNVPSLVVRGAPQRAPGCPSDLEGIRDIFDGDGHTMDIDATPSVGTVPYTMPRLGPPSLAGTSMPPATLNPPLGLAEEPREHREARTKLASIITQVILGVAGVVGVAAVLSAGLALGLLGYTYTNEQRQLEVQEYARNQVTSAIAMEAVPAIRQVGGLVGNQEHLELLYFQMDEARSEAERQAHLRALVEALEAGTAKALPHDPSVLKLEQARLIGRVKRLREALEVFGPMALGQAK